MIGYKNAAGLPLVLVLAACSPKADSEILVETSYELGRYSAVGHSVERKNSVIYESFEGGGWNAQNTTLNISEHKPGLDESLPQNFLFPQLQGPHSFAAVKSIVRFGEYAAKLHWKSGNPSQWNGDPLKLDNTDRKAMFHGHKASSSKATVWYGFSVYFPSEGTRITGDQSALFFQIHGSRDKNGEPNRIPPLSINLVADGFKFGYSWDSAALSTSTSGEGDVDYVVPTNVSDYQDRWLDVVIKVNTNPFEEKGSFKIWFDGELITSRENIRFGYNDQQGIYPSFGWYITGQSAYRDGDMILYLDEVRMVEGEDIGYFDVAPGFFSR
ncbi:heparin lyase I family protein [Pelagicoccus enzymogenes]|uniref:heparin lyase I family protein n=1 Tax=Pelagicoccus enzymogenes TaxID=2773457 RepID=UPI00280E9946|nr:heparin lyase I family protein [Pelagicoccus enzymogenes]MDQ8198633.1 heparin lyase I family protein [Pelagicoccus enzymogenes]